MAWENGDSGERLRTEVKEFIERWIQVAKYKSSLPAKHIRVVKQGEQQHAGINIVIFSATEPDSSRPFRQNIGPDAGSRILEESHTIVVMVKADKKAGGSASVSSVHNIVRRMFSCLYGTPERDDLIAHGVFNLFEATEGIQVNPGEEDEEGVFFKQQINLNCTTDTLLP